MRNDGRKEQELDEEDECGEKWYTDGWWRRARDDDEYDGGGDAKRFGKGGLGYMSISNGTTAYVRLERKQMNP